MCGRFTLHVPNDEIHERFQIARPLLLTEPRYNIAPTQTIAVVTPARELVGMRWGLVPRWSKDGKPFINARAETITEKPSFKTALRSRRVLVPFNAFYEWRTEGKEKVPMLIRLRSRELFAVAGVWEPGVTPEAPPTVALITVAANSAIQVVHDRMPAILRRDQEAEWLHPQNPEPEALLRPYDADAFELFTVSARVNGVKIDEPSLIEPERRGLFG